MKYSSVYQEDLLLAQKSVPEVEALFGKSVLVTGACGMIGSAIVDFLLCLNSTKEAKIQIYAGGRSEKKFNQRFAPYLDAPELHYFAYDAVRPLTTDIHFDFLILAASNATPYAYAHEPVETMMANYLGSWHALEYARSTPGTRILYISSSEVYGKKEGCEPFGEKDYGFVDILNPRACYPSSKRAAETLCAAYLDEYGVDTVIVRPGHIYGPTATAKDDRASSEFPRSVKKGENIVMKSAGTQMRSYCYVIDCATAILTVLLRGKTGSAYNISNRNAICSIRQMAEAFANAGGVSLEFANPSDSEKKGYNLMDNSSLDALELEKLGWSAIYDMKTGADHTLQSI